MTRKASINLRFPIGGLNRRFAYQSQPPFTTPDALNVRPASPHKRRMRGGVRPGTLKAYTLDRVATPLGSANPVRMLAEVSLAPIDGFTSYWDGLDANAANDIDFGTAYPPWVVADFSPCNGTAPLMAVDGSFVFDWRGPGISAATSGVVDTTGLPIDNTKAYSISLLISPDDLTGVHVGMFDIWCALDGVGSTDVEIANGFRAQLDILEPGINITLIYYASPAGPDIQNTVFVPNSADGGWFTLLVDDTTLTAYWQGKLVGTYDFEAKPSGLLYGFGMTAVEFGWAKVEDVVVQYYTSDFFSTEKKRILVASANGIVYRENGLGDLTAAANTDGLEIESDRMIAAEQYLGKLYIADHGIIEADVVGSATMGADAAKGRLASGDVSDWTDLISGSKVEDNIEDYVVEISNGQGNVVDGTYAISAVVADYVTLADYPPDGMPVDFDGDGACSARIARGAKTFDAAVSGADVALWMTDSYVSGDLYYESEADNRKGSVPINCPLIARQFNRMILAGDPPHVIYYSRIGYPHDFDFAANVKELDRATGGPSNDEGIIPTDMTAIVPHLADHLVIAGIDSLWVISGDPALGSMADNLSRSVGMIGVAGRANKPWCHGPGGELIFLSLAGLYGLPSSLNGFPEAISESIPKELVGFDPLGNLFMLEYDPIDRGVHIYITPTSVGSAVANGVHFWFDWDTKSFWPMAYPATLQPTSTANYSPSAFGKTPTLLGCRDGFIRRHSDLLFSDDGHAIKSFVLYGPIRIGGSDRKSGLLLELEGILGQDSGDVTWSVYVADSEEEAVEGATGTAFATGTWSEGRNYINRPRAGGAAMVLKLSATSGRWFIDKIRAVMGRHGVTRLT